MLRWRGSVPEKVNSVQLNRLVRRPDTGENGVLEVTVGPIAQWLEQPRMHSGLVAGSNRPVWLANGFKVLRCEAEWQIGLLMAVFGRNNSWDVGP
jgi:hypothetical protein